MGIVAILARTVGLQYIQITSLLYTVSMATRGITILTCGLKDLDTVAQELSEAGGDIRDWFTLDLRPFLKKDPADTVGWHEDCTSDNTCMVVIGQEGSTQVIYMCMEMASGICREHAGVHDKFLIHCHSGWHRASTVGRLLESNLNSITDDEYGGRAFNAQCFHLHNVSNKKARKARIVNVVQWDTQPWALNGTLPQSKLDLFGYRACMGSQKSADNWNTIFEAINAGFGRTFPSYQVEHSSSCQGSTISLNTGNRPSICVAESQGVQETHDASPRRFVQEAFEESEDVQGSHAEFQGNLPAWASFQPEISNWWQLLDEYQIDEAARQALFCLAQLSDQGYYHANSVIAKLIKKKADGIEISNPSGFVVSCVRNARLECGGIWHTGKEQYSRKRHKSESW